MNEDKSEAKREKRDESPDHPSASNPIARVIPNPLSDTTTTSAEPERPEIVDGDHSDQTQIQEEVRGSRRSEHPFPSIYELGDVEDADEDRGSAPGRTNVESHGNAPEQTETNGIEGTWSSNTLTLASTSTAVAGQMKGNDQRGRMEMDWEETWERQKREKWQEKVRQDLEGWRGGHGTPRSNYSPTAVVANSYYGSPVTGTIGRDLPKEVLRVERDWSGGEICQFETNFPMELERRITPTQFNDFVTTLNSHLTAAYSTRAAVIDNLIAIATWWISLWFRPGHFETELRKIEDVIARANKETFNPVGLNVLSPRRVALQFLEIEYY